MERVYSRTHRRVQKLVADAGYESEENYSYLENNSQAACIKTTDYEQRKKRKYKENIYRADRLPYDEATDSYVCPGGKLLLFAYEMHGTSASGYKTTSKVYRCESSCTGCPHREKCFYSKSRTNKIKGYVLCDSELELHNKKYTVYKNVRSRMPYGKMIVSDTYQIQSPIDLINLEMLYAVTHDMTITKCKNCGKYFVARNAGTQYCDRVFMAERTCRQLGAKKSFNENLKTDEALLLYEKTYQATYYKTRRANSQKELNALGKRLDKLKNYRLMYKRGEISAEEFLEILEYKNV